MEYIRTHFLTTNRDNIELRDLESGGHTSIYPEPGSSDSQIGVGDEPNTSTYPAQPAVPNSILTSDAMTSTDSMQIETSRENLQSSLPAEVGMQLDANQKRSWHQDHAGSSKVRIVPQTSRIPMAKSVDYL